MKVGLLICTYNRPEYLRECLSSVKRSNLKVISNILIVDDNSTDSETLVLIEHFDVLGIKVNKLMKSERLSIKDSLLRGYETLFTLNECDIVINLDSDAVVRNDFIRVLLNLKNENTRNIITGFNCNTLNKDGSVRHNVLASYFTYNIKRSVGGINWLIDKRNYFDWVKPALDKCLKEGGNWDSLASMNSDKDGYNIVCAQPSVIQHIGLESAMGHSGVGKEQPDVADDFKLLCLRNVTLICIDCVDLKRAIDIVEKSSRDIIFRDVKILSSLQSNDSRVVKINHLASKQDYSKFVLKELNNYFNTDYVLIVQHDGYVVNAKAWRNEWLQFDYMGAVWNWYKENKVGNGGFSLRSKKLCKALSQDNRIIPVNDENTKNYEEDNIICRVYRSYLEEKYNINFATEEEANLFSIESFRNPNRKYNNQFGFHGTEIYNLPIYEDIKIPDGKSIILNQPFGLGDIMFIEPIARYYYKQGYSVVIPIIEQYYNIKKHFPYITFIDKEKLNIDYNCKVIQEEEDSIILPMRWSAEYFKSPFIDVMKNKYKMVGLDYDKWRELNWERDFQKEEDLFYLLGLNDEDEYNLINEMQGGDKSTKFPIKVTNGLKNIYLKDIEGYTLLDWGVVIERATTIHSIHTAINYIIEILSTKAELTNELHMYSRDGSAQNFLEYEYLFNKEYTRYIREDNNWIIYTKNKKLMAATGIVIPCYNRPHYLKKCLDSLKESYMLEYSTIMLIDDCSENKNVINLIEDFEIDGVDVIKIYNKENLGVWGCLKKGFEYFIEEGYEILCNIDSDAIVDKFWQIKLKQLYLEYKNTVFSGFNAGNSAFYDKGEELDNCYKKERVLGLNLYFNKEMYKLVSKSLEKKHMWDVDLTESMKKEKKKYITTKPSVMQHIGMESSMGHSAQAKALDFNN